MSFSDWFNENQGLVNSVAGMVGPAPEQEAPRYEVPVGQPEPARMDTGGGGGPGLGSILGLVASIYTGGAAGAALGAASTLASKKG